MSARVEYLHWIHLWDGFEGRRRRGGNLLDEVPFVVCLTHLSLIC